MRRIKRRLGMLLVVGAIIWSCTRDEKPTPLEITPATMPFEGDPHKKTWLSFSGKQEIKQNLILIASTIAQYESVTLVTGKEDYDNLLSLLGDLNTQHYPIEVLQSKVTSPWIRDEGPSFVYDDKASLLGIHFNYQYLIHHTQTYVPKEMQVDSNVTQFIISKASAMPLRSNLVVKASCIEVDGIGTAIMTEPCIVNDTLNPYWDKKEIEAELKVLLGLQKIIWLKDTEDPKNHRTVYARFVREGVILVYRNNNKSSDAYAFSRKNIALLKNNKDLQGKDFNIIIIDGPQNSDENYLGYYLTNHALIMQSFSNDYANYKAYKTLQLAFPDRSIEEVNINAINAVGGDICKVTLNEPKQSF